MIDSLVQSLKAALSGPARLLGLSPDFDCRAAGTTMSAYIDSMSSDEEARLLEAHVAGCPPCRRQLQGYISLRSFVVRVPAPEIPSELALDARIRLSHARSYDPLGQMSLRVSNVLRPRTLPALAGTLAALTCFAVLLGSFGASLGRQPDPEAPVIFVQTQPRPHDSLMIQLAELGLDDLTMDLNIDQKGKVFGEIVLVGSAGPEVDQWLKDVVLLAEFQPATLYGRPIPSPLILSFDRVS